MAQETVRHFSYRPTHRLLNSAIGTLSSLGAGLTDVDPERLRAEAVRSMGSDDWGGERFFEPMQVWADATNAHGLTALGKATERLLATRALVNRLRMTKWLVAHPEVRDIPIERPVFVVGPPRTGTTLLQNLLAEQANWRALRWWELSRPVPQLADEALDRRWRVGQATIDISASYVLTPEMGQIHAIGAQTREECWPLFANSFQVLNLDLAHGLTQYGDWLLDADMVWTYEEYRLWLQVLLHQRPSRRLVLKCPEHLWFLDALLKVFPDACVVWTHRDPFAVIPSYCSMTSLMRRNNFGEFDTLELGEQITHRFTQGIERALAVRGKVGPDRFYDVRFGDLLTDPVKTVVDIKQYFGLEHDDEAEAAMRSWLERPREDDRGSHVYKAERFGISTELIDERFGDYIQRFGVERRRTE